MHFEDFIKNSIDSNDRYILDKMNSKQFELSSEIIRLESLLGINQKELSYMLKISMKSLLKLESADTSINIEMYKIVISKLKEYLVYEKAGSVEI